MRDLTGSPVVNALLSDAGIKLVDIGGRGSAFATLRPLAPYADYYVSEPDAQEAERLKQTLPQETSWRSVTVLPEAMAAHCGDANLYLTQHPGMSSLLEPDPRISGRFYLEEQFRVDKVVRVSTRPLDDAASTYGFADACFLKLDTQGTELDILQSGARLLQHSVLGVHTESLFHPFYKGQSLFADIDTHLRHAGFSLYSLSRTTLRRGGYRPSMYSNRVISWAHCLYLREPDALPLADGERRRRHVARLLGLALTFQYYDLALELVRTVRDVGLLSDADARRLSSEAQALARASKRRLMRKSAENGADPQNELMSPNFRDKHRDKSS